MGDAGTQGGSHPTLSTPTSARPALQQPVTVSVAGVTVSAIVRGMTHLANNQPLSAEQVADLQSMLDDLLEHLDQCASDGDPDPEEVDELLRDVDTVADRLAVHWRKRYQRLAAIAEQHDAGCSADSCEQNTSELLGYSEPLSTCDPLAVVWWHELSSALDSELDAMGIDTSVDPTQCTCPAECPTCQHWRRTSCTCSSHPATIEAVQA